MNADDDGSPDVTGMGGEIRILMLEDTAADAELMEVSLREAGIAFSSRRVQTREAFVRALEEFRPDIVLSDFNLPAFDGRAALQIVLERRLQIPVVMVTGAMGDELAVDLLKAGARDYVLKDRLARLPAAVTRALAEERERRDRQAAERALRESEEKFRAMSASAQDAVILLDSDGNVSFWNAAAEKIFGYSADEMLGRELHEWVAPERFRAPFRTAFEHFRKTGEGPIVGKTLELMAKRKDGAEFPMEVSISAVRLEETWHAIGIVRDITARKRAEQELYAREQEFRALAENSPDEIVRYDRQCRRLYVNPALEKVLGLPVHELLGKTPVELMPESARLAEYQDKIRGVFEQGVGTEIELMYEIPGSDRRAGSSDGLAVNHHLSAVGRDQAGDDPD